MRGNVDDNNFRKAISLFEQATSSDARFALAYTGIADASLRLYKDTKDRSWAERATAAAEQAQRLGSELPEVHFALGSVYAATGKTAQAVAVLRRAVDLTPNSDDGYRRLGDAYRAAGSKAEALQAYQRAVELNPYYWYNYNALGSAYALFGDNEHALAAFQRVTQVDPDNPIGYRNIGVIYFNQDRWKDCVPEFEKSLQLQANYIAYSNLGTAYFYLHRFRDAVSMFEKAVEMNPKQHEVMGNLADAYRWSGQRDQALTTYDRAISLASSDLQVNPRNARTMGLLALYYAKKGDISRSQQLMARAVVIDPNEAELAYFGAIVDLLANQTSEALASLNRALAHGYSAMAVRNDPELSTLQNQKGFLDLLARYPGKS
jgi:tetratricopeptide (TPR) repeat protein